MGRGDACPINSKNPNCRWMKASYCFVDICCDYENHCNIYGFSSKTKKYAFELSFTKCRITGKLDALVMLAKVLDAETTMSLVEI